MRRPSTSTTAIATLGLVGTLLLTACGGTDAAVPEEESPLTMFYQSLTGDLSRDEMIRKTQEDNRRAEELTAECMAAEGFEYIPDEQEVIVPDPEEFDPVKDAAENGYGMTVTAQPSDEEQAELDSRVDPNQAIVNAMSESEMTAYYIALQGDTSSWETDEDGANVDVPIAEMGCWGRAQDTVSGDEQAIWGTEEMTAFNEATTVMYEAIPNDPRMIDVAERWADCMADAGFDYSTPDEPAEYFLQASNELYGGESPVHPGDPKVAELAEQEKSTAVADQECRKEVEYDKVYTTVQFELEETFVAENKDLMDRVVAASEEIGQ
ncbi:hypothetical protein H9623_04115 [Oerskovia sp. Sa1BUA8]|uniref:Uncharacterized protein n=1 Tax=Oerskovia douganii TaxID=2762210 RepID=A0A9D5U779_9CELL|nr:hypothetical protein [Oerskovia douganii]MBE7699493.1 hypothetical protein [Oerskovia douganii]